MSHAADEDAAGVRPVATLPFLRSRVSRWFYCGMATTLLVAVVVAFAPTFFLRGRFDVPPIPAYLYVHGVVLTVWFVLLLVQTSLVATHRVDIHRRLGLMGTVVAGLVVVHSAVVVIRAVPRLSALGIDPAVVASVVIGNFLALIVFSMMVTAGVHLRRKPETHKRLMLLACFSLVGPVVGRLGLHVLALPPALAVELERPAIVVLVLVLVSYDLRSFRRVHPATKWGGLLLASSLLLSWILAKTTLGITFLDTLR